MIGYDIKLNRADSKFYNFLDKDSFTLSSLLMYKISYKDFLNVLEYEGCVSEKFYTKLQEYDNYVLLSDTKSNIVIKVDDQRKVSALYYLDLKSDLDILEISYNFPKLDNFFECLNKRKIKKVNDSPKIVSFMQKELKSLIKNNDLLKIDYLISEWGNNVYKTKEDKINFLNRKINGLVDKEYLRIYDLIKLSHKKSLSE